MQHPCENVWASIKVNGLLGLVVIGEKIQLFNQFVLDAGLYEIVQGLCLGGHIYISVPGTDLSRHGHLAEIVQLIFDQSHQRVRKDFQ